jgi:N-acetyl-gamma-glutamyl-phosphate reductase
MIKTGIIGAAGYTGGELIRLLVNHPQADIQFALSKSSAGKKLHQVHHDLLGVTDLAFTGQLQDGADVLFLCAGHGEARKFLLANPPSAETKVIDLSNDFRLQKDASVHGLNFVYGLPELNREKISTAHAVANPGCFATAIQLGLLPLAQQGWLTEVYTTGITGSTGAGQTLADASHFSWRANNIQPYKTLTHQHLAEIQQSITQLQAHPQTEISFVPWRGDFTRGIFVSSTLAIDKNLDELYTLYKDFYAGHPFTQVSETQIFLKQVVNTNNAIIHLEKHGNKLVVHSAIDNLLKGASGQALQNMNLMFGLDEKMGLQLKAGYF